ncbi:hypothetical protein IWX46DRAFT_630661 [Phyllosticta citricarpa]|uniref:Uncharacterized protein n=1 Tax=Phyllosticta citricarpa TaxID=55181 RepID=A0ABR1L9E2_9PEZI
MTSLVVDHPTRGAQTSYLPSVLLLDRAFFRKLQSQVRGPETGRIEMDEDERTGRNRDNDDGAATLLLFSNLTVAVVGPSNIFSYFNMPYSETRLPTMQRSCIISGSVRPRAARRVESSDQVKSSRASVGVSVGAVRKVFLSQAARHK